MHRAGLLPRPSKSKLLASSSSILPQPTSNRTRSASSTFSVLMPQHAGVNSGGCSNFPTAKSQEQEHAFPQARCAKIRALMERAGEFLGHVVRRLKQPDAAFAWLASAWPSVAGPALAAHTRPLRCDGACLELEADGRAWQRQLETMQRELCGRINQAWGGTLIREVKFVVTKPGPQGIRHEIDNEYRPFIRHRRS
jgi:hypothetical protein